MFRGVSYENLNITAAEMGWLMLSNLQMVFG